MVTKFLRRAVKSGQRAPAPPRRSSDSPRRSRSYYLVAGVALDQELERLRALPVFADGPLATRRPELKVRRAGKRPNRLGFAVPTEFRLQVTAYPEIRPGDIQETLLHELVHLHVGRAAEPHAWHGRTFKQALATAMKQAYGITIRVPSSTRHGTYAEAIERRGPSGPSAS
jgi:SprT-like family